jgi:hypothetical protein
LDTSSLAILANTDANVVIVAFCFDNADADAIISCSSAAAAAQCRNCNLQLPPKDTSQCSHTAAIFQHHCRAATIFQRSIHNDCCVLIFSFNSQGALDSTQ